MGRRHAWLAATLVAISTAALAQDEAGNATTLEVTEIVLSKAVESGNPVDPGTSFSARDGRIYATIRLNNPSREATTIRVVFQKAEGEPRNSGGVELDVPARPRYRTVARTGTGRAPGRYRCVVFTSDGTQLSSVEFDITE